MSKLQDMLSEAKKLDEENAHKVKGKEPKKKKEKKKKDKKKKKEPVEEIDSDLFAKEEPEEEKDSEQQEEEEEEEQKGISLDEAVGEHTKVNKHRLLFNMYFSMLQYYLSKGKHLKKLNLDDESMQIEHDRIFTKDGVKRIWTISYTEEFLPEHFFGELKHHLDRTIPGSRTSIILTPVGSLYTVDFQSKDIIQKVDYWDRMRAVAERREQNQTEADKIKDTEDYKKRKGVKRMFNSFTKYKAYGTKQFKFAQFYVAIEGLCRTNEEMIDYDEVLSGFCSSHNVRLRPVTRIHEYLNCMSLTTKKSSKYKNTLDTIILSDLDIAELDAYSQGSVGDTIGVYAGTDVETDFGVYLNFTASTKAQNILITAITGGGKSFFIKCLLMFHALCGHRLAIMDYEGKEYIKLVKWLKGVSISMSLEDSIFVNTLKIPDVRGMSLKKAKAVFQESYNATENIFKILANVDGDFKDDDIQLLFEDLMNQLHTMAPKGPIVKENPTTYARSQDLDFFRLFKVLEEFREHESFKAKHGKLADLVYHRLAPYWGYNGSKNYLFKDEIQIQDMYDSKILHFNFGMQNNTDDSAPPKETLLKISMMTYVFAKYHGYNLEHGYYTVNLLEEFQRSGNSKQLLRTVNHWITGGRKGNIVNYIVTNAIGSLLNNPSPDAQSIKDNITTLMIGKCRRTAREQLVEAFDLQEYEETIQNVSKKPEYNNCFLLIFDTGLTRDKVITLMNIAPNFIDNEYFKTRREEKYEEWEI